MQNTADYRAFFLNDTPMMDVRAPVEFNKGAFPHSVNHPLMNDPEREAVGTCYKKEGQKAAIALGHSLVKGDVKKQRIEAWQAFHQQNPDGLLYCFRGGLRSSMTQQWLAEAGIDMPFIEGGYKAMRQFLLAQLHERITQGNTLVLSGPTGTGKTEVINDWPQSVDLEGLANHRGSAFGSTGSEQPSQIDFENAWSVNWLKLVSQSQEPVLFEDESRLIGRISLLPEYLALSKQAQIVLLNAPLQERIERIRKDYFVDAYQSQLNKGEEAAIAYLDDFIRGALTRIKNRLGGERYKNLLALLDSGLIQLVNHGSWGNFDDIIEVLLSDYYDPMYAYQLKAKAHLKIFEGNHQEVIQWLSHHKTT
ncbi:MAG: tRNA 2-selenouridine synthase [Paraglaciecola sp.]